MRLRENVPKAGGVGVHREISADETFNKVAPHFRRAGLTRMADVTGLDRIGIPVYSAICPYSNDTISVYTGKGATAADARTGAAMEAIERFSAWQPMRPAVIASYEELRAAGRPAMDPAEHSLRLSRYYRGDRPISWVESYDLLNQVTVLVPQDCAGYNASFHEPPCYRLATTNGLASGNSIEEAVCHALSELIERDAITLAEIVSSRLSQVLEKGLTAERGPTNVPQRLKELHPHVDPESLPPRAQQLLEKIHDASIEVRIVDVTSELGIPTFLVATAEELGPTVSHGHGGFGTHPDAEVAIMRAITECAQGRAVDFQATREDISLPDDQVPKHRSHVQRAATRDSNAWAWRPTSRQLNFSAVPSRQTENVMDDVTFMLERIQKSGVSRVLAVDLSPPNIPVNVVRVIAPGLESWAVDSEKIGRRGANAWNEALRAVLAG